MIIEKDFPDSFQKTHLQQQLVDNQVGRIIITGNQSEICVDGLHAGVHLAWVMLSFLSRIAIVHAILIF